MARSARVSIYHTIQLKQYEPIKIGIEMEDDFTEGTDRQAFARELFADVEAVMMEQVRKVT